MNRRRQLVLTLAAAVAAPAFLRSAHAADGYPSRPVRMIVPFPPGGSTDVLGRLLAEALRSELGQPIVVENRPGAGGNIGGELAARAPADGHTVLMAAAGPTVINPSLYAKMGHDPARDLAPVTLLVNDHNLMAVSSSVPAKTVTEFIAWAKQRPGKVTFGSPGNGSPAHLGGELFNQMAGVSMIHVPYKGSGPAVADLLGGQIDMMIDNMPALMPHVAGGKLRALAVASEARATGAPDIPTVAEAGLPGFKVTAWKGLMVPAGTPAPLIARLQAACAKALQQPELRQKLIETGAEPIAGTPAEFGALIDQDTRDWARLVKSTGARID